MRSFYEEIQNTGRDSNVYSLTVLNGSHAGEKAIVTDREFCFMSAPEGFLMKHRKELLNSEETEMINVEDSVVFVERIGHPKKIVICGCGHVSLPIIRLSKMIGLHVTAIDDRPEFVKNAKDAGADIALCGTFEKVVESVPGDGDTYFVIVTRGHHWDFECLKIICRKPHAYIGMMGSERRARIVRDDLISIGIEQRIVKEIHSPIGLDIRSETPEEIAVSVLAEIISEKNKKKDYVYPKNILTVILNNEALGYSRKRMVLATIVSRSGSAPREAGAKMLVLENGEIVNTIGGGCVEASVIRKAHEMMATEKSIPQCLEMNLNADEAAKEGEVCGGTLTIFMEEL